MLGKKLRKPKKMVETTNAIRHVFNEEWVKELREQNVFKGDVETWKITAKNIPNVL